MKVCFKCNVAQPRSAFYAHPKMADGLLGKCVACSRTDAKAYRGARIEYYRAYDRARGNRQIGYSAEYAARFPERRRAQVILGYAVRAGRIEPWPCCALPDCDASPEAHHTHYDSALEVVWLCPVHHKQAHAMVRN